MGGRRVRAPDGSEWVVRRRWTPHLAGRAPWQRIRRRVRRALHRTRITDADPGCLTELVDDAVVVVVVVAVVLAVVFLVVPLIEVAVDLVVLVVVTGGGVAGRVLFRRPWTIEALSPDGARHGWKVVGWRASAARREEVARELEAGSVPPADEVEREAAANGDVDGATANGDVDGGRAGIDRVGGGTPPDPA